MSRIARLVVKDLRRRVRAPLGYVIVLLFPLIFSGLIALTFGRGSEPPRMRVLLENRDTGLLGQAIDSAAGEKRTAEHFDVQRVTDGRARMEKGEASALLIVPADFTRRVLDGEPAALEVVRNPAEGIMPEVATDLAGVLVEFLDAASHALRGPVGELRPYLRGERGRADDPAVAAIALSFRRTLEGAGTLVFPPAITLAGFGETPASAEPETKQSADGFGSIFVMVLAGISVYALFLVGDLAMRDLLVEAEDGTLRRLAAAPLPTSTLLAAKVAFAVVLSSASLVLIATIAAVATRGAIDLAGFALLSAALVLAVTGISSAIYGLAGTQRRGATIASGVYLVFGFTGGSFIAVEGLPAALRAIAPFSPFYWATAGYRKLLYDGATAAAIAPHAATLATIGLAALALGTALLRRALARGRFA